ncbi:isoaspartyl peptidase/L-asparaginase family protein [Rivibacter subsaxonicus]|uniref:Isoaspartyl peptidase n=1 Tax=Rivibacter subsaxonicus TaxID=457575 RepID=A0A4Q7VH29_9BURK|nr:isoaspartyl peptidase/L-asparaginase [Rivibacter subsaxonicus]RZT95376.1 asparaginase [Rivibacter subsaxonicus]
MATRKKASARSHAGHGRGNARPPAVEDSGPISLRDPMPEDVPAPSEHGPRLAIAIHGGAGTKPQIELTRAQERVLRAGLEAALDAGLRVLRDGGSALDAVCASVVVLEDDPLFNAGCGAVFNELGEIELEAAVMDGATHGAGSVTGVQRVRNPVLLARAVMERTSHVTLGFAAADAFAQRVGMQLERTSYFHTETRWKSLQIELARRAARAPTLTDALLGGIGSELSDEIKHGTVGAVALDQSGNLAAATSTGGRTGKMAGRIGDTPTLGAGTWADEAVAVSCTGHGEWFMRSGAAHEISARVRLGGMTLEAACRQVIGELLPKLGGADASGGAIAVDRHGRIAMPFNCEGMYRAAIDADGNRSVAIYRPG